MKVPNIGFSPEYRYDLDGKIELLGVSIVPSDKLIDNFIKDMQKEICVSTLISADKIIKGN